MTLIWIVGACFIGGVISLLLTIFISSKANQGLITNLVSLAVGTMLGTVFLELLPHAFELSSNYHRTMFSVLVGILIFFILEKLLIWRHCHGPHCETHAPEISLRNKKGSFVLMGDIFHNFVDGVLIASAFLVNINLGLVTALAIIAHEIPQEMSNTSILLHSGYSRSQTIIFNTYTVFATLFGAVISYYILDAVSNAIPLILALAASSMIYVSVSDLIPGLHKKTEASDAFFQVILISLGVLIIYVIHLFLH